MIIPDLAAEFDYSSHYAKIQTMGKII
jgi:hypothetical protein